MLVSTLDAGPSFKSWADGLVLGVVVIVVVDDEASLLLPYWNSDCSGVKTHDDLPSAPEHDGIRLACTRASDLLQRVATREDICLSARPINWEFLLALLQRASESIIMIFCSLFSGCQIFGIVSREPARYYEILSNQSMRQYVVAKRAVLARSAAGHGAALDLDIKLQNNSSRQPCRYHNSEEPMRTLITSTRNI